MLPPKASNSHFVCCRDESPHRHLSISSANSSCSSRNSYICFTSGGALFSVLSVTFSRIGVRNGHLPLSCVRREAVDSMCFSAAATFFLSLFGPLVLLVELVIVDSIIRNHRLSVRRYAVDSICFSAAATFFLSLFGPWSY